MVNFYCVYARRSVCCSCGAIKSGVPLSSVCWAPPARYVGILRVGLQGERLFANCFHWRSSWALPCFQCWTLGQQQDDDNCIACAVNYTTCVFLLCGLQLQQSFCCSRKLSRLFSSVIKLELNGASKWGLSWRMQASWFPERVYNFHS